MRKRPHDRADGLSTNCTVTRRGLLVARAGWLRAASIVERSMRHGQKKEKRMFQSLNWLRRKSTQAHGNAPWKTCLSKWCLSPRNSQFTVIVEGGNVPAK